MSSKAINERYIVNENEIALLERFEGIAEKTPDKYLESSKKGLAMLCELKDKSIDLLLRRNEAARAVINIIASKVGIDPNNTSFWLYAPSIDGTTPITDRIEEWFSRSGEKAQLKRRVQELEQENAVLRSLIQK